LRASAHGCAQRAPLFRACLAPQVYIIWSILFIVYIILIIVTAFITIALTYFQVRQKLIAAAGTEHMLHGHPLRVGGVLPGHPSSKYVEAYMPYVLEAVLDRTAVCVAGCA